MAEKRQIKPGSMLMYHVINSQAGSLEKALLENIMNAIDAEARRVDISLSAKKFVVRDDGTGFARMDHIEKFFEVLGFDHGGDNHVESRQYGEFGIGRAQNLAFARTVWRTSEFRMDVDVKHRGMDYELERGLDPVEGCEITGHLYDPLKPSDRARVARSLADLCKFMPIPVHMDGKQINTPAKDCKWTFEDENAYYLFNDLGSLNVYNLGAKVHDYPAYQYGTGGVIVSKKALRLNTARSDVLQSVCKVWPEIKKVVQKHVRDKNQTRKTAMTESERDYLASQFAFGEIGAQDVMDSKIITDVGGRHHSFKKFFSYNSMRFTVAPAANDRIGERLHKQKIIFVLNPRTLSRFNCSTGEEFAQMISERSNNRFGAEFVEFDELAKDISDTSTIIPDSKLKPVEKGAVQALRRINQKFRYLMYLAAGHHMPVRDIRAGESDCNNGWTDGATYIAIERKQLRKAAKGMPGWLDLLTLMLHEYCHDSSDLESHGHDQGFYELFERASRVPGAASLGGILQGAMKSYATIIENMGRDQTKANLLAADIASTLSEFDMSEQLTGEAEGSGHVPAQELPEPRVEAVEAKTPHEPRGDDSGAVSGLGKKGRAKAAQQDAARKGEKDDKDGPGGDAGCDESTGGRPKMSQMEMEI